MCVHVQYIRAFFQTPLATMADDTITPSLGGSIHARSAAGAGAAKTSVVPSGRPAPIHGARHTSADISIMIL
jgi:hypothetical protein